MFKVVSFINLILFILLPFIKPILAEPKPNYQFSVNFFGDNEKIWRKYLNLNDFYQKPNKTCLEIGSAEGSSTVWIAENLCNGENSRVDVIDIWLGDKIWGIKSYEVFMKNTKHLRELKKLFVYKEPSLKVLNELIYKSNTNKNYKKYDFIYVDGSHTAKDVLTDIVLAFELLEIGGIMILDDYTWQDPTEKLKDAPYANPKVAIDGFLATYESMYEILFKPSDTVQTTQIAIKKIADRPDSDQYKYNPDTTPVFKEMIKIYNTKQPLILDK